MSKVLREYKNPQVVVYEKKRNFRNQGCKALCFTCLSGHALAYGNVT